MNQPAKVKISRYMFRVFFTIFLGILVIGLLRDSKKVNAQSQLITLTPVTSNIGSPIGIGYQPTSGKLIISTNYSNNGNPYNFATLGSDGIPTAFSSVIGLADELKIAIAPDENNGLSQGGFPAGSIFAGNGIAGQILRVSSDGNTIENPWVVLPGENAVQGVVRTGLCFDNTGVFNGDLVVATISGNIWRINSSKVATKIASLNFGFYSEGLTVIPNNTTKYGPWAGKILVGDESNKKFYAIDSQGNITPYTFTLEGRAVAPEDIDIIPANQNLFIVDYGVGKILGAPASAFTTMVGDIAVTEEDFPRLCRFHWNGTSFEVTKLAEGNTWESATFAPSGVGTVNSQVSNIEFSASTYNVIKSAGTVTITVNRGGNNINIYSSVDYTTSPLSAVSPINFTASSGRLSFAPGETSKTFSISIINDQFSCDKQLQLKLSNPTMATLGTISTATLTIKQN